MMEFAEQIPVENKFILWLKWTGFFVLAYAIMLPLMHFVPLILPGVITQSNASMNLVRLLLLVLNGLVLSYLSALAIRSYLPNFSLWIFLSTITWVLGSVTSISPLIQSQSSSQSPLVNYVTILASLAVLVPIGIVQWLMLRVRYQKSGFLILWYFATGATINLVFSLLFSRFPGISAFLSGTSFGVIFGFNLLIEFCLFAIVGIGIVLVLTHPYSPQPALDAERRLSTESLVRWGAWTLAAITIFETCQAFDLFSIFSQGIFSTPPWNSILIGLFYGLIFGLMQFLFFRQQVDQAYLWIPATVIGGGLLYFCQSAGANLSLFTGSPNQPSAFLVLAFTALGWLGLGASQAVILNTWQYPRAWAWIQITFAAYGLVYLVQFFISLRLGLMILPVLTGLGLQYILKAANGQTWHVAPVDSVELTPDRLETLRYVLQARIYDLLGKRIKVTMLENKLAVFPVDLSLDETLTSLLTQPGKVSISCPTGTGTPIMTDEDIISAELVAQGGPEKKLIRLSLTDDGTRRCNAAMQENSSEKFFLFLDGESIHSMPLEISDEDILELHHLDAEDADFYFAILNNDCLPCPVSLDKGISEDAAEEQTA